VARAYSTRIHSGTDRDTEARAKGEPECDSGPTADQNADRCPDTGPDADTEAGVLDFL